MNRQTRATISLGLCVLTLLPGCTPKQPYYFAEDGKVFGTGDLSHYLNVATEIEYPDVDSCPIDDVAGAKAPLTISNSENFDVWDLTLEEATRIMLTNSKVMRQLGGRITDSGSNIAVSSPSLLTQNGAAASTVYDPALVESGNGTSTGSAFSGTGVEAALSQFDATLDASVTWNENDRPQNFRLADPALANFFAPLFQQDLANGTIGITKNTANGSTFSIRNNYFYDQNNNGSRIAPSDWVTNFEATFNQPLLQGAGTQVNQIAGFNSFQQAASTTNFPNQIDGVIISRIRHDIALTDFEEGVSTLMRDVEDVYWELYFAYRDLDARKIGRDSALETWKKVKALKGVGTQGGEADKEAQARAQFFVFQAQVESALTNLFRTENKLRYMMGIAPTDGRLIRPIDEPVIARVDFDWPTILTEALARRTELRSQKWQVKRREMELVATKNNLLPRLDWSGTYRWMGAGNDLLNTRSTGIEPYLPGSTAFDILTSGRFQEWQMALQLSMPIGFRRALSGVRHHQLLLARERALLEDMELEVTQQLTDAVRDVDFNYQNLQTRFSGRAASQDEVDAVRVLYDAGRLPIDLLLQAQQRRADAETTYFRSLVDYNRAIMRVHYGKGSLLEYNGVYLAEGPWPNKAYYDATQRARHRDASTFIDYGYTRPNVISRGPYGQFTGQYEAPSEPIETPTEAPQEQDSSDEVLPLPGSNQTLPDQQTEPDLDANNTVAFPIVDPTPYVELASPEAQSTGNAVSLTQYEADSAPVTDAKVPERLQLSDLTQSQSLSADSTAANPFRNPNRQEFQQWMDVSTGGMPSGSLKPNPLRQIPIEATTSTPTRFRAEEP